MLSGEGNENGENATIGLISKKVHFFGQFFVVVLHDYNDKLPETSRLLRLHVLWRTCPTCFFVAFFFHYQFFSPWLSLALLIFSPLLQNFMLFLQQKMSPLFFSLAVAPFLRR